MTHIATFANTTSLFNQTLRLQTNYSLAQEQSSSGLKAPNGFQGIASDTQTLLGLDTQIASVNAQSTTISNALDLINGAQDATSNISNVLDRISSVFSGALGLEGASDTSAAVLSQAQALRGELVGLLNTQVAGRYVFGGNVQNTAPVDITDPSYNAATPSATVPDTNYYQGDNAVQTVRASDTLTVNYSVTADNPAFEQALRALNLAIANPGDATTIGQAYTMIKSAISGVADITGDLNAKNTVLTNEQGFQSATLQYLTQSADGLRGADVAAATVQATQIETQLQSSYGILSKVLNLRLSDYLR